MAAMCPILKMAKSAKSLHPNVNCTIYIFHHLGSKKCLNTMSFNNQGKHNLNICIKAKPVTQKDLRGR